MKNDVNFLYEIGTLRNIRRGWNQLSNAKFENMTEHVFRVAWISLLLSSRIKKKVDTSKLLQMALGYRIYTARCSDHHYVSYKNKEKNYKKAIGDMLEGVCIKEKVRKNVQEYFKRESIEAKIVYTANILEDRLELRELASEGYEIAKVWEKLNDKFIRPKLLLPIGKKYWREIEISNPHNWHLSESNRFGFNLEKLKRNNGIAAEIDFLFEIGCLRFIDRTWVQFVGDRFSNLIEHVFRTAWIATIIANGEVDVDLAKLLKMALLHDINEIRSGDANYITSQYVKRNKEAAVKQTLQNLKIKKELFVLWKEAEFKKTKEAKILSDSDALEPHLELLEQEALGMEVASKWKESNTKRLRNNLRTKTGKLLFKEILKSDPHSWHLNAANRFRVGDWR